MNHNHIWSKVVPNPKHVTLNIVVKEHSHALIVDHYRFVVVVAIVVGLCWFFVLFCFVFV